MREPEADAGSERPSRSARRRDALDVLALAKQLTDLPAARHAQLPLPDDVREELAIVQRIPSHIARKRQVAHLAKLMRRHGEEAFTAVRAALEHDHALAARSAAAQHRVEGLRESLLDGGDAALAEFIATHPGADRQRLRTLIRQAQRERDAGQPPRAQRELFRLLRDTIAAGTE